MKLTGFILVSAVITMASTETALDEFAAGNLKFTARLYNEIKKANPNTNFIFSPLSVEIILALAQAGAKGQTAEEFTTSLNLPTSQERTRQALKAFLSTLKKSGDDLKLLSANKMFLGKNFDVLEAFRHIATSIFEAGVDNVDFGQAAKAAGIINQWVEGQTNNKIKDLIQADSLTSDTKLVLVNALYFSGKWETPFEKYLTRKEKFYTSASVSKEVDMMQVTDSFRYYEDTERNVQYLELPYIGGDVTMTIVLPREKEGLAALENDIEPLLRPQPLQRERVDVRLPKFLVESDIKLKPILKNLGLQQVFSDGADLSGISSLPLKVDDVIQKAFINVSESGTEAAAATAVSLVFLSAPVDTPPRRLFNADHPFFYYISQNGIVLFTGRVSTNLK